MNKDAITQVLQEILQENPNYFFPKQLHVLSWKSKKVEGALITKINGQRYLGILKKDSQGQDYWKYKLLKNPEPKQSSSENSALPTNSVSVQVKEEQCQEIENAVREQSSQPSKDSSVSVEQESEQVKNFRKKYGNPNQTQKSTGT